MLTDYDGLDVFDEEGEKIGTVERTYVDDNFKTQLVKVKMGTLLAKHRLVPLDDAEAARDGLHVPFSKKSIQHSPDVSHFDDTLDGDLLQEVQSYYGDLSDANIDAEDSPAARSVQTDSASVDDLGGRRDADDTAADAGERPIAVSTEPEPDGQDNSQGRGDVVTAGSRNGPSGAAE